MKVGETDPTKRRIPLVIYVSDGSALALTAATSPPAGSMKVACGNNGHALNNAIGTLVHLGSGSYYYEADASEVSFPGFISFTYVRTGFQTTHVWVPVGDVFNQASDTSPELRIPFTIYTLDSPPVLATGATVTTASDLNLSFNGAAYVNADGTMTEVGLGLYYYQGTFDDIANDGTITMKYESSGFGVTVTWWPVDTAATVVVGAPTFNSLTEPGQLDEDPSIARWKPIEMSWNVPAGYNVTVVAQIGLDSALWMTPYDEGLGGGTGNQALSPLFEDKSTVSISGTVMAGRTIDLSILPNGGWQRPDIKLVAYVALEVTESTGT